MREIRTSGSEGGGIETNRYSLPLSEHQGTALQQCVKAQCHSDRGCRDKPGHDSAGASMRPGTALVEL